MRTTNSCCKTTISNFHYWHPLDSWHKGEVQRVERVPIYHHSVCNYCPINSIAAPEVVINKFLLPSAIHVPIRRPNRTCRSQVECFPFVGWVTMTMCNLNTSHNLQITCLNVVRFCNMFQVHGLESTYHISPFLILCGLNCKFWKGLSNGLLWKPNVLK